MENKIKMIEEVTKKEMFRQCISIAKLLNVNMMQTRKTRKWTDRKDDESSFNEMQSMTV